MGKEAPIPVLVADDDPVVLKLIGHYLDKNNIKAELFESANDLIPAINDDTRLLILDMVMPGMSGLECVCEVQKSHPYIESIILTSRDEARMAIDSVRAGVYEYLTKPFDPDELVAYSRKAMLLSNANQENQELKTSLLSEPVGDLGFVGESSATKNMLKSIAKIAKSENTVMLSGESGTGKGVLARAIHKLSSRADAPFVTVSCPAMPRELIESEMFGHEKGAFSGALQKRLGRVEMAKGGTLFLDEVGEMPMDLQPKLLNFLQDRNYYRIGGQQLVEADVRIIVATNRDLKEMVDKGTFREDLYFRLNVLPIEIPPLSKRREDIPLLVQHFNERISKRLKMQPFSFHEDAIEKMCHKSWMGNVRELENFIERALTFADEGEVITAEDLMLGSGGQEEVGDLQSDFVSIAKIPLVELERMAIRQTLEACNGVKVEAARCLGITEKSVYNKIKRLGLD